MNNSLPNRENKLGKIIFGMSALTLLLIIVFRSIDIYKYAVVGAIFEMLWLFIIATIFILPIVAIWELFRKGFSFKSFYLFTILISVVSLVIFFY